MVVKNDLRCTNGNRTKRHRLGEFANSINLLARNNNNRDNIHSDNGSSNIRLELPIQNNILASSRKRSRLNSRSSKEDTHQMEQRPHSLDYIVAFVQQEKSRTVRDKVYLSWQELVRFQSRRRVHTSKYWRGFEQERFPDQSYSVQYSKLADYGVEAKRDRVQSQELVG